ncbi:MAG: hypothetical protein QW582_01490, partial [Candidatus Micrarchaeaceae archaeon]
LFTYEYGFSPQAALSPNNYFPNWISYLEPTLGMGYNISGGYDSNSYIFQHQPTSPQHALWGWSAIYANLSQIGSGTPVQKVNLNGINLIKYTPAWLVPPTPGQFALLTCKYTYSDAVTVYVDNVKQSSIPIPVSSASSLIIPSKTSLYFNGNLYPLTQIQSYMASSTVQGITYSNPCSRGAMWSNGAAGPDCYSGDTPAPNYRTCAYELSNPPSASSYYDSVVGYGYNYPSQGEITCYPGGDNSGTYTQIGNGSVIYKGQYIQEPVYIKGNDASTYYVAYNTGIPSPGNPKAYLYALSTASASNYTNVGSQNAKNQEYNPVSALPYLLFNLSMPSATSDVSNNMSYMNLSLDLYSPHNYLNPANYLDPLPLDTGSAFFANISGELGVLPYNAISPQIADSNSMEGTPNVLFFSTISPSNVGTYSNGNAMAIAQNFFGSNYMLVGGANGIYVGQITNPTYITVAPNGYVYIMNKIKSGDSSAVNIYMLKFIPKGYFALSTYQPSTVPSVSSTFPDSLQDISNSDLSSNYATLWKQWESNWINYWNVLNAVQDANLYLVGGMEINYNSKTGKYGSYSFGSMPSSINNANFGFLPSAMAIDYSGDIFLVGSNSKGKLSFGYVLIDGSVASDSTIFLSPSTSTPTNLQPLPMLAAAPGGQYVYSVLSFRGYGATGNVSVFFVNTSAKNNNYFAFVGNISLSYSTSNNYLLLGEYLANGGPYPANIIKQKLQSANYSGAINHYIKNTQWKYSLIDSYSYHHPLGLYDINGILYVLDNWTFPTPITTSPYPMFEGSSILMLRAFAANGTEIPIDPQYINDTIPAGLFSNSYFSQIPASSSSSHFLQAYPPYGWPIAANISIPAKTLPYFSSITFCNTGNNGGAIGCDYTPNSLAAEGLTSFPPIGPHLIMAESQNTKIWLSANYNNTAYMFSSTRYGSKVQNSLVSFSINIVNYTKMNHMAYEPYTCYVNSTSKESQGYAANSPCLLSKALLSMSSPVIGAPDSFAYTISQGSPMNYLSLQNVVGSLIPTQQAGSALFGSTSAYSSKTPNAVVANALNSGCNAFNNNKQASCSSNEYPSNLFGNFGSQNAKTLPAQEYIQSSIQGYLLVPYNLTYTVENYYTNFKSLNGEQGTTPAGCPTGYDAECKAYCDLLKPTPASVYFTGIEYGSALVPTYPYTTGTFNITVQGGPVYLRNPANIQDYYQANLSDAGAIKPPQLSYIVLSNRLFGEMYINQSVAPTSSMQFAPMKVLNQSNPFRYSIATYMQEYAIGKSTKVFNAFQTEYISPNPVESTQPDVPQPFYYAYNSNNPNLVYAFPRNFAFNRIPNASAYTEIYNLFSEESNLYNTSLKIFSSKALGYNRFIYTFVDEFNNTIYAPLDIDLANQTYISLNVSSSVDPSNANSTYLTINGFAGYYSASYMSAPAPLPANSPIYLYYDSNINYVNAYNSTAMAQNAIAADICAFSLNSTCTLANPLNLSQANAANVINFNPNYDSSGACPPQPNSMISNSIISAFYECNIYGNYGLPASGVGYNGNTMYCDPVFMNGTGTLTSQIGLIGIAYTNSNGNFSYKINACGAAIPKIIAEYYGWPPPEPQVFKQVPLALAGEQLTAQQIQALAVNTLEYNFSFTPASAAVPAQIGNYVLSFGSIEAPIAIAISATLLVLAYMLERRNGKRRGA